jgi:hypothetical protein
MWQLERDRLEAFQLAKEALCKIYVPSLRESFKLPKDMQLTCAKEPTADKDALREAVGLCWASERKYRGVRPSEDQKYEQEWCKQIVGLCQIEKCGLVRGICG